MQSTHWTRSSEKQPARGLHIRPGRRAKRPTRPRCHTAFRRCWCRHGPAGSDCGAGQRVCAGSGACFGPPRAFPVAGDDGEGPQPSAHLQNAHPMRSRCSLIRPTQRRISTFSAVTVGRPGERKIHQTSDLSGSHTFVSYRRIRQQRSLHRRRPRLITKAEKNTAPLSGRRRRRGGGRLEARGRHMQRHNVTTPRAPRGAARARASASSRRRAARGAHSEADARARPTARWPERTNSLRNATSFAALVVPSASCGVNESPGIRATARTSTRPGHPGPTVEQRRHRPSHYHGATPAKKNSRQIAEQKLQKLPPRAMAFCGPGMHF